MNSTADPRPLFARALDQARSVVAEVRPTDLERPTPCAEFDVRALTGHVVAVLRRITHVAGGGDPFDVPQVVTDVPGDGWATAYDDARAQLDAAWADDAVLDRVLRLPFGSMPGRAAVAAYTEELTVHSWDLATALGRGDLLDDELAGVALAVARAFIPEQPRGGRIPFGPVVPVPPGSGPYAELAGWLGRTPLPMAMS